MLTKLYPLPILMLAFLSLFLPTTRSQNAPAAQPPKPHPEVQVLLDKADQAKRFYRWEEALRLFDQALAKARTLQDKDGEAAALGNIGDTYYSTGQPLKALDFYRQALPLYKQVNDKGSEANTLNSIGAVYYSIGQPQQSLPFHQQAVSLFNKVGDKKGEAASLANIGAVYAFIGQPQQALDFFQQAIILKKQVGDKQGEANTLNGIGQVYASTGQPQKALDSYQRALLLNGPEGDKRENANTLVNIGTVYLGTGQPQQALGFFQRALPLYKQIGDKRGEAVTLNDMGYVYYFTGQAQQALDFFQQSLTLKKQVGDKRGEATALYSIGKIYADTGQLQQALDFFRQALTRTKQMGATRGVALALNDIGTVYLEIGQPQHALLSFQQALPLFKQIGDLQGEALALGNIGNVYAHTGQPQQALDFFQQAIILKKQVGDKQGEALALNNIAYVYHSSGQLQKALDFLQQALTLQKQMGDKRNEALALANIGTVYLYADHPQQALDFLQQALALKKQLGDKAGEADVLNNLGMVYGSLGQSQQELSVYRQALPLFKQIGAKQGQAIVLCNLAVVEQEHGQSASATQHLSSAVTLLDNIQAELSGLSESQIQFHASYLPIYHSLLHLMLSQHNPADAFTLAQKTKARTLLDLMQRGKVRVRSQMTAEEQQEEQRRLFRLRTLQNALLAPGSSRENDIRRYQAQKELTQADRDWQKFQNTLFTRHRDLQRKRAGLTLTLKEVPSFLSSDTALLEYVVLKAGSGKETLDETVLFCVTLEHGKPHLKVYTLPIKSAELTEKVRDFHDACAGERDYQSEARKLARLLVAPAAKQIAGKKRLVLCPDGPLWELPFQALLTGTGKFLYEQYELAYAYSASGVQAAFQEKRSKARPRPSASLLALADPDFGDDTRFTQAIPHRPNAATVRPIEAPSPGNLFVRGGGLIRLKGTRQEADTIKRLFPDARLLLDKEAQEATVKREAGKYRYLHFATHGLFNSGAPLLSCIALAQPPKDDEEDGFLSARELFDMDLSAEMVVLSACETGRGEKQAGEGILGLTWALFVAGAPTQVVSQWSVADESTAALMQRFYANLKAGMKKGAALRQAALAVRKQEKWRHPYFWAPFVLVGDWN